jgi:hypothetical protein
MSAPYCEFGNIVAGAYNPVLAKYSKNFSLEDSLAIGVDRGTSGPLKQQVEGWQALQLSTAVAMLLIYQVLIEDEIACEQQAVRLTYCLHG